MKLIMLLLGPVVVGVILSLAGAFGLIPPLISSVVIFVCFLMMVLIVTFLVRGPAQAFIEARLNGGIVLGVMKRDKTAIFGTAKPVHGMVRTKSHGAFTIMPESIYIAQGVPVAIAPESVGFTVKPEHAQLVKKLKKDGIKDVTDLVELDEHGFPKKLKNNAIVSKDYPITPETVSYDDLYLYVQEAANPAHQDANIQIGIAQGLRGVGKNYGWLVFVGLMVLFVFVGLWLLLQYHPPNPEVVVRIAENVPTTIVG